MNKLNRD